MLINMCIVILTTICKVLAYNDNKYSFNVGTVLFSAKDKEKIQWTKRQISLLQARRYFQTILPSPDTMSIFNDDSVNSLLDYFRNAYKNIKREATDPETDSILTTALSDALGGYMKVWILPIAKLDYYGGTISQKHVIKLLEYYNEIKSFLDTDGKGWHAPDDKFLKSVSINVVPVLPSNTRRMVNPCDHLAYFEKTPDGLGIPLPNVKWNEKSSTMFVPLKNMSLVPMSARNSSDALVKYYDTAKKCLTESNPAEVDKFDAKFQTWLISDILPHLKDEHLYLALGNVLTLLNSTQSFFDDAGLYEAITRCRFIGNEPLEASSKKMMIIFIILLLEIAWCIPALLYLLCSKKRKESSSNVYLFIDQNKPPKGDKKITAGSALSCFKKIEPNKNDQLDSCPKSEKDLRNTEIQRSSTSDYNNDFRNEGEHDKTDAIYSEFEAQYPSSQLTVTAGTGSRSYFSSKNQSSDVIRTAILHSGPKRSSLKKSSDKQARLINTRVMIMSSQDEFAHPELFNCHSNDRNETKKIPPKRSSHSKECKFILSPNHSYKDKEYNVVEKRTEQKQKTIKQHKPNDQKYDKSYFEQSQVQPVESQPVRSEESKSERIKTDECQFTKATAPGTLDTEIGQYNCNDNNNIDTTTLHVSTDYKEHTDYEQQEKSKSFIIHEKQTVRGEAHDDDNKLKSAKKINQLIKSARSKKYSFTISDSVTPYSKITIDEPRAEISVDISGLSPMYSRSQKPSKIPKWNVNVAPQSFVSKLSGRIQSALSPSSMNKPKSMIPQPKHKSGVKKTVDDIVLSRCCCEIKSKKKFNDTL